jgi:hypothetical protein
MTDEDKGKKSAAARGAHGAKRIRERRREKTR